MWTLVNHILGNTVKPRLLIALGFLLATGSHICAQERALFSEATPTDSLRVTVALGMEGAQKKDGTKRVRFVTMDVEAMKGTKSGRVMLNMFPDKAFRVELEPVSNRSNRHVTHSLWKGKVVGIPDSEVRVSIWDEHMYTSVRIGTAVFTSEPLDESHAIVRELDLTAFRGEEDDDGVGPELRELKE